MVASTCSVAGGEGLASQSPRPGLVVSLGWPEEAGAKRDDHQPRRRPALWWRPRRGLTEVGRELGFREVSAGDFVWCGKRFRRRADGSVAISMEAYHRNMKPIYMPKSRLTNLTSPLVPEERRRLRSLLGGFQWLVAQLRFDLQFPVSSLQSEHPTRWERWFVPTLSLVSS